MLTFFKIRAVVQAVKHVKHHPRILPPDRVGQEAVIAEQDGVNIPQSAASSRPYSFFDESASA